MPKTRQQKEKTVKELADGLKRAKSVVFTSFSGLSVADSRDLRNKLRNEQVEFEVSKKTLLKKALSGRELEISAIDELKGNIGVAFGLADEVAPAKIIAAFNKAHDQLKIEGGILENKFLSREKIKELALLPSKLELLAKLVGTIKAPISGFVNVMAGNLRGLVNVLNAIKEKK